MKKLKVPVDLSSNKPCPVLSQMRKNKNKKTPNHSVQGKKYRVTYTICTDIENDYLAESETEAKAMFCKEQGLPVKDFIQKLKVRELK